MVFPGEKQTTQYRLHGLDHLRALAITMVLFYHYRMFQHPAWIDDTMGFAWTGVDLFFVLSGYLISSQLFEKIAKGGRVSFPEFFIKRFFRIIPAYLVVLAIYFLFPGFHEREALPPLWKFLTFTQNFGFDIKNFGTFSHVWSLCVEEHFYLFFPLVILIFLHYKVWKKAWILIPAIFLLGFAARLLSWHYLIAPELGEPGFGITWYKWMYYPTYNRLDGLLAGVGIAALFTFKPKIKTSVTRHGNILLLSSVILLTGAWFLVDKQQSFYASIFGYPVIAAGYGLLVAAAVSPSCILYRLKSYTTTMLAKWSFALYLCHKGVIHIAQPLFIKSGIAPKGNLMFLLCLLCAVAGALVLHKLVEEPFLRLRRRILQKRKEKAMLSMAA